MMLNDHNTKNIITNTIMNTFNLTKTTQFYYSCTLRCDIVFSEF